VENVGSETGTKITAYGNALDVLTQQCRDLISRDTWVAVHGLSDKVDHISDVVGDIRKDVEHVHDGVNGIRQDVRRVLEGVCLVEDTIGHVQNSIDEIKYDLGKDGFHTVVTCPKQLSCRSKGHP